MKFKSILKKIFTREKIGFFGKFNTFSDALNESHGYWLLCDGSYVSVEYFDLYIMLLVINLVM